MIWKCRDLSPKTIEYLEGLLPPFERRLMESHLADCPSCRKRIAEHRQAWDLLDLLEEKKPSPFFVAGTMREMRNRRVDQRTSNIRRILIVAAACLMLTASLVFYFLSIPSSGKGVVETDRVLVSDAELLEDLELMEDLDFLVEYGEDLELAMEYDLYHVLSEEEDF
ncbi:MAG: zf-HC2 domain-containing protein [Planctomycetota bacterium]